MQDDPGQQDRDDRIQRADDSDDRQAEDERIDGARVSDRILARVTDGTPDHSHIGALNRSHGRRRIVIRAEAGTDEARCEVSP